MSQVLDIALSKRPELDATPALRIAVIVASINRREEIGQILQALEQQTHLPSTVILSVTKAADVPEVIDPAVTVIFGPAGLTRQRNLGLVAARGKADVAVFYDDDFLPAADALAGICEVFSRHDDVVGATGLVLADGIKHGGLDYSESLACLEAFATRGGVATIEVKDFDELYGCNMAVRMSAAELVKFDEKLPLYGWQEDVDFAGQLLTLGRVVRTNGFAGVHRGVTKARSPGVKLGVSQIVNPVYLARKRTMRPVKAFELIARNLIANHLRALRPEPYVDRAGRVRGNWLGLWYLATGRVDPELVLRLP